MEGFDTTTPGIVTLRRSIGESLALADALGLSMVAIWLEHARQELGPRHDDSGADD